MTVTYAAMAQLGEISQTAGAANPNVTWVDLFTCSDCGSVVRGSTEATHTAWHEALGK
jgi:hypothetical protein